MEDWWLVRTKGGETGWIYGRMIDVTAPDTLARYAEGQRIVGAYVLTQVEDPESNIVNNGQPVTSIPEYVTVLSPFKAGLPYDFNQIRVFIWNVKKHRYETAFRERNVAGYLPVTIALKKNPYNKDPHVRRCAAQLHRETAARGRIAARAQRRDRADSPGKNRQRHAAAGGQSLPAHLAAQPATTTIRPSRSRARERRKRASVGAEICEL